MKYKIGVLLSFFVLLSLNSCRQYRELKALSQCDFRFQKVENITAAGVNIQKIKSYSDLDMMKVTKLTSALLSGTFPLEFTADIEVRNPGKKLAALNKIEFMAYIDNIQILAGSVDQRIEIPAGKTAIIPLKIRTDVRKILSKEGLKDVVNFVANLVDRGDRPTRVGMKIKPTITLGRSQYTYPKFITLEKEFKSTPPSK